MSETTKEQMETQELRTSGVAGRDNDSTAARGRQPRSVEEGGGPLARLSSTNLNRRRFLGTVGAAAGVAVMVAACGDDDETDSTTGTTAAGSTMTTAAGSSGDIAIAELAAGLEKLAVDTYTAAGAAAGANKLGAVPPAVGAFVTTALAHHTEHLAEWNKVLKSAGRPEVTAANAKLKPIVDERLAGRGAKPVKDVASAAQLALDLEEIASDTYFSAIPKLKSKDAIKLAGQILVVDQQHQAILLYALGQYPVKETFVSGDKAAS